jgi:DNA-binding GntR family transcriptional regulator
MRVLEAEGFVSFVHNRGAWVTPLSMADLQDVYVIRIELETEAVRRAEPLTSADVDHLDDLLAQMTVAHNSNDHDAQLALNRELHFFVYERANSPRRLKLIKELWLHSARYQRLSIGYRHDAADSEHRKIVEMLRCGDHDGAADALKSHLQTTVALLGAQVADFDTESSISSLSTS